MLLDQSREELAVEELRQVLAESPEDPMAHAVLGICLASLKKFDEASQEVETAIHLAPEEPFVFYANSHVLQQRKRYAEAEAAISEAIGMDPYQPQYFAQLSQVQFAQRRWQDALDSSEQGLALDPEDVGCTNIHAMALVKLGRKMEAGKAIETALKRDPEDAVSHANMGWALLEKGDHKKAMEHFREALRLNPEMEWARVGIIEAMKANYFLYRLMLNWFLWMMKLTQGNQWGILIGAYIGFQVLVRTNAKHPEWSMWLLPIIIAYVAFALMTWLASPLFDLVLRLNRFGRLALSREQIITSNWVGLGVLGALTCVVLHFYPGLDGALLGAVACVFMVFPISRFYDCDEGTPRNWMIVVIVLMAMISFFTAFPLMAFDFAPKPVIVMLALPFLICSKIFVYAAIGMQIAVNVLVQMTQRS